LTSTPFWTKQGAISSSVSGENPHPCHFTIYMQSFFENANGFSTKLFRNETINVKGDWR